MRVLKSHPLLKLANSYVIHSPRPCNLSYMWNFGFILAFCLIIQIVSGVTLAMHYNPSVQEAFNSVEHIMRDVNNGWLIRYIHSNTASAFFFIVYLHIGRGLYYGLYKPLFATGIKPLIVIIAELIASILLINNSTIIGFFHLFFLFMLLILTLIYLSVLDINIIPIFFDVVLISQTFRRNNFRDYLDILLARIYIGLEWCLNSPPKPHAFIALPLQSTFNFHTFVNRISIKIKNIYYLFPINIIIIMNYLSVLLMLVSILNYYNIPLIETVYCHSGGPGCDVPSGAQETGTTDGSEAQGTDSPSETRALSDEENNRRRIAECTHDSGWDVLPNDARDNNNEFIKLPCEFGAQDGHIAGDGTSNTKPYTCRDCQSVICKNCVILD